MLSNYPERWLPVSGYEGLYEVSDFGNVRSLDRLSAYKDGRSSLRKGRILKAQKDNLGRLQVRLSKDGVGKTFRVHRLVLEAFDRPRPEGLIACHWDDNPENNRLENLRWDTPSGNNLDQVRNGNHYAANRTHCPQGHEYAGDNLIVYENRRYCRTCQRRYVRESYHRKKNEQ